MVFISLMTSSREEEAKAYSWEARDFQPGPVFVVGSVMVLGSWQRYTRFLVIGGNQMVTFETMIKVVQVDRNDDQPWLVSSPVCSMLNQHKIALCGIARTTRADDLARAPLSGPAFLACLSGRGKVRLGNEWIELSDDEACLQSPIGGPRLRSTSDEPWTFGWSRIAKTRKRFHKYAPMSDARSIHCGTSSSRDRRVACGSFESASTGIMESWVDLIQSYVRTFTEPFNNNDRLQVVWSRVQSDLKEPWSVDRLASMLV